jgi:DNA invertase Pin-like site-specific DNA recombinase
MIALRLRAGRQRKAEKGGFAYGAPGYGYRAERGELVAVEDEQRTLGRIAELHAGGASLREIAATLTDEGHTPKQAARRTEKAGQPSRWHPETIKRICPCPDCCRKRAATPAPSSPKGRR